MLKKILTLLVLWSAVGGFAAVDVNQAQEAELDSIKGIGPAMSARILAERNKGQFKSWADLVSRVRGLGEKNVARYSAQGLTVNGAAYNPAPVGGQSAAKATQK